MMADAERLNAAQFQEALRQAARFRAGPPIDDPLAQAVERIEQNPAFSQSRLLARLLVALTYQKGEFRRAEIAGLDAPTVALAIGVMDAFGAGTFATAEWEAAVSKATAAGLGVA